MRPLLVLADFVFDEEGERAFLRHRDRCLAEVRGVEGCLQAVLWTRPGRRYRFSTLWTDRKAVDRWVDNEFHRTVLVPGFRQWCVEGCFEEHRLEREHERVRKCSGCGRWTRELPGWDEARPARCARCQAPFPGIDP